MKSCHFLLGRRPPIRKTRFFQLFGLLLLAPLPLLLVACQKSTDRDQWSLEPEIHSYQNGEEKAELRNVRNASLDFRDFIEFKVSIHSLLTESQCTINQRIFKESNQWKDKHQLHIIDLIPIEALAFPSHPQSEMECSFQFVAENRLGSVHRFSINHLLINAPLEAFSLQLQVDGKVLDNADMQMNMISIDELHNISSSDRPNVNGSFRLECEDFTSSLSGSEFNADLFKLLATGPQRKSLAAEDLLKLDVTHSAQICRMVFSSEGKKTASRYFRLLLPQPKINIEVRAEVPRADIKDIFKMFIHNQEVTPQWLYFPQDADARLSMRPLLLADCPTGSCRGIELWNYNSVELPVQWVSILGSPLLPRKDGSGALLLLEPKSDAILTIRDFSIRKCMNNGTAINFKKDITPKLLTKPFVGDASPLEWRQLNTQMPFSQTDSDQFIWIVAAPLPKGMTPIMMDGITSIPFGDRKQKMLPYYGPVDVKKFSGECARN